MKKLFLSALVVFAAGAGARAADFELSRPAVEMRRLQYCQECREPLVVTTIAPGAAVRCPKCKAVARRLPDRELLIKVYQVCPSCASRLDVSTLAPDAPLRCGACGLVQRALPDAIYLPHSQSGTGEIPPGAAVDALPPEKNPAPAGLPEPRVPGLNAPAGRAGEMEIDIRKDSPEAAPDAGARAEIPASPAEPTPLPDPAETLKITVLVNGQPVSAGEVRQTVLRNLETLQLRDGKTPASAELADLKRKITEELIDREILRQAAAQGGFTPREEDIQARLAQAPGTLTRAGVKAEIILEEMKKRHAGNPPAVSEAAVERYYREHREDFLRRPRLRLRALTVFKNRDGRPDRRPAETITAEIKEKLDFGIQFAAVASRYSEDVFRSEGGLMRGSDGGDLVSLDDLAEPLYAVFARPRAGAVFGPLQLVTGYAFCLVEKVEPAPEITLEAARADIRARLQRQGREAAFRAWFAGLKKAAVIEYQE